jgi:hypothetical protein
MKSTSAEDPDMRKEYDFTGGEVGKYSAGFAEGSNVVVLEPDVAKIFPDSASVNRTLRAVGEITKDIRTASAKRRETGSVQARKRARTRS